MVQESDIIVYIKTNASWLWGIVSFLGGLLIGNWQAIGRDKRKEWNELTLDSFNGLRRQVESDGLQGDFPGDIALIENYIPFYKRFLFRRCLAKYNASLEGRYGPYDTESGSSTVDHEKCKHSAECAKALLRYFKRR